MVLYLYAVKLCNLLKYEQVFGCKNFNDWLQFWYTFHEQLAHKINTLAIVVKYNCKLLLNYK